VAARSREGRERADPRENMPQVTQPGTTT
jgi:hypothetical protein